MKTRSDLGADAAVFASEVVGKELKIDPKKLKLAILHEDSAFGTSVGKGVKRTQIQLGLEVVASTTTSPHLRIYPPCAQTQIFKPDVIIATSYINDAVLLWKTCKQLGLRPKALIGTSAGTVSRTLRECWGLTVRVFSHQRHRPSSTRGAE